MAPNVEPGKPTTFVSMGLHLCPGTAFVSRDCIRVHGIAFVSMERSSSELEKKLGSNWRLAEKALTMWPKYISGLYVGLNSQSVSGLGTAKLGMLSAVFMASI